MFISKIKLLVIFSMVLQVLLFSGTLLADEALILAVHPYLPAAELVKRFDPLANYLSRKIGQPLTLKISKDYKEHIDLIGKGEADIAYMGPASYVSLTNHFGNKPLLARLEIKGKPFFKGVIIVRRDSKLYDLPDLAGKSFAFGDPDSTMSYLVPKYMLISEGIELSELAGFTHMKTHNNVALSVLAGDFDAGAVKEEVFYKYHKRGLRALRWTPAISEHVFVASDTLSSGITDALRSALIDLRNTAGGDVIMKEIKETMTAIVPAKDADYDNLRHILRALKDGGVYP